MDEAETEAQPLEHGDWALEWRVKELAADMRQMWELLVAMQQHNDVQDSEELSAVLPKKMILEFNQGASVRKLAVIASMVGYNMRRGLNWLT